jgi:hypothetical protein
MRERTRVRVPPPYFIHSLLSNLASGSFVKRAGGAGSA